LAETLDEQRIIDEKCGMSPVEYCHSLGILDRNTIAAHCVHLSQKDMDIMAECGVNIAHNPQSNMKLASGIAPIAQMIKSGINVGLGTDGASSNNDLDMWEEMRTASLLAKVSTGDPCALPAYEALKMATVNGAVALGVADRLGTISEGMIADLILVNVEKAHLQPMHNLISTLVYATKSSDVDTVIVGGQVVVEKGRLTRLDMSEVIADARRSVEAIVCRMNVDKN
jgi:5-methylthioadenosine/S-adenosylhomocysteine deaminase